VLGTRSSDLLGSGSTPLAAEVGGLQLAFLIAAGMAQPASLIAGFALKKSVEGRASGRPSRRTGPDEARALIRAFLSDHEERAWHGPVETHESLTRAVDARLLAEHHTPLSTLEALIEMAHAENNSISVSDLAERIRLSPIRTSRLAIALERQGLAERRRDSADARSTRIAATDAGRDRLLEPPDPPLDHPRTPLRGPRRARRQPARADTREDPSGPPASTLTTSPLPLSTPRAGVRRRDSATLACVHESESAPRESETSASVPELRGYEHSSAWRRGLMLSGECSNALAGAWSRPRNAGSLATQEPGRLRRADALPANAC